MPEALSQFISENAKQGVSGVAGKAFLGLGVVELANSENKLKSILGLLTNIVATRPAIYAMFTNAFGGASRSIDKAVRSAGAMDAALRKIGRAADDAARGLEKVKEGMLASAGKTWAEKEIMRIDELRKSYRALAPDIAKAAKMWGQFQGPSAKEVIFNNMAQNGKLGSLIRTGSGLLMGGSMLAQGASNIFMGRWMGRMANAARVTLGGGEATAALGGGRMAGWLSGRMGAMAGNRWGAMGLRALGAVGTVGRIAFPMTIPIEVARMAYNKAKAEEASAKATDRNSIIATSSSRVMQAQIKDTRTYEDQMRNVTNAIDLATEAYRSYQQVIAEGGGRTMEWDGSITDGNADYYRAGNAALEAEANVRKAIATGPSAHTERAVREYAAGRDAVEAGADRRLRYEGLGTSEEILRGKAERAEERAAEGEAESGPYAEYQDKVRKVEMDLLAKKGLALAKITEESHGSLAGAARAEIEAKFAEEISRGKIEAGANSSSEIGRMESEIATLMAGRNEGNAEDTDRMVGNLTARKLKLQESVENAGGFRQTAEDMKAAADEAARMKGLAEATAKIESESAQLRLRGYDAEKQDAEDTLAILKEQLKTAEAKAGNETEVTNIKTQIIKQEEAITMQGERRKQYLADMGFASESAKVSSVGMQADKEQMSIRKRMLEGRVNNKANGLTPDERAQAQTQLDELNIGNTHRARSRVNAKVGVMMEWGARDRMIAGDTEGARRIGNQQEFLDRYEELKNVYETPEQAQAAALALTSQSIEMRAIGQQGKGFEAAAVSDLARIGGGGGVEAYREPLIDLTKETNTLLTDVKTLLEGIENAVSTESIISE